MNKLQILGTGYPKYKALAQGVETAAKELGLEYELEKVTDINKIMTFGVMITPGWAVDGEVKVIGKVPSLEELKEWMHNTWDFATLTEIPITQALIKLGMHQDPVLALLWAGPALSLPNILVIRKIMGNAKTAVFILLVVAMSTIAGMFFGVING